MGQHVVVAVMMIRVIVLSVITITVVYCYYSLVFILL